MTNHTLHAYAAPRRAWRCTRMRCVLRRRTSRSRALRTWSWDTAALRWLCYSSRLAKRNPMQLSTSHPLLLHPLLPSPSHSSPLPRTHSLAITPTSTSFNILLHRLSDIEIFRVLEFGFQSYMRGFKITVPGKGDISLLTKDVQLFHALLESISFFYSLFLLFVCYIVDFVYFVFFYYDKEMPERTDLQVKICNLLASVLNILSSDKGSTLTNILSLSLSLYLSLYSSLLYVFFYQNDLRL